MVLCLNKNHPFKYKKDVLFLNKGLFMLIDKGIKKNLLTSLGVLINDYNKGVAELAKNDAIVLGELYKMIHSSIHFIMPHFPEDYKTYEKKKKIDRNDLNMSYMFEYTMVDYDDVFFFDKEKENKVSTTHSIFYIKKKEDSFLRLESAIGKKIKGDLVFLMRVKDGFWELPNRAFVVDDEYDCIEEIELFPNLYFQLTIEKDANILEDVEKRFREFVLSQFTKYSLIVFNNDEEFFSKNGEVFFPASFLEEKSELVINEQNERIKAVKSNIFDLNMMYSNIIRTKSIKTEK